MKKAAMILFAVSTLCLQTLLQAQDKITIGLEASPGITSLRGNPVLKNMNEPCVSFSAGFTFQYNINKSLAIRTGIGFERKGSVAEGIYFDGYGNTSDFKLRHNFDYLTLPLLLRGSVGNKVRLFMNAGPFIGYLLSQNTVNQGTHIMSESGEHTGNFKRLDFGLCAGIGAAIPLKNNLSLSFELRNNLGLCNISDIVIPNNGSIKTNAAYLTFGLMYTPGSRS